MNAAKFILIESTHGDLTILHYINIEHIADVEAQTQKGKYTTIVLSTGADVNTLLEIGKVMELIWNA